ncbi:Histone deacetylase HDT1 [Glycine max]|nr:Histone deacetylase HDT1 [Glycine max]
MDAPMEFWGVEVKVGQTVTVDPMDPVDSYIHISQVALGEAKKDKPNEPVVLYLKVGEQKIVLGTLSRDGIPHLSLDLVLDSDSELSHTSKSASVFFCGYKVLTSEEDEELALEGQDNGKPELKAEGAKVTKPSKSIPKIGAPAKAADPKKDEDDDSDDESDDDLAGEDESGSSDEMDDDSNSEEESDGDDEETPAKKVDQGKKRPNESAAKTPISAKKAKTATPEKTDGKKSVHVATPHPSKKGGKTPNSTKGQTPNSAGQLSCASCKKSFTNEAGLQQHKKAKHGGQ